MTRGAMARTLAGSAEDVAPRLLGWRLVREVDGEMVAGVIVEVEAYLGPEDRAAHSFGGRRTSRNESMYGRPGTAYVYFTYGMHHCVNVVCGAEGVPHAVLVRALVPSAGLDAMRYRRLAGGRRSPLRRRDLCSGPGKLCQALAIDRALDGADLLGTGPLRLAADEAPPSDIRRGPRIGIDGAGDWRERPLRWWVAGCEYVSRRLEGEPASLR